MAYEYKAGEREMHDLDQLKALLKEAEQYKSRSHQWDDYYHVRYSEETRYYTGMVETLSALVNNKPLPSFKGQHPGPCTR